MPVPAERLLRVLLRLGGTLLVLAFLAALLPTSWMEASHARTGLPPFPEHPLTEYLTRSVSLLYGFHGVLLFLVSTNLRRFRPIVRFLGVKNVLFGTAMLAIDGIYGMPWWWTASEGPPIFAIGVAVLVLAGRIPDER